MGLRQPSGFWIGVLLTLTWPCPQASAEPVAVRPLVAPLELLAWDAAGATDGVLTPVPWSSGPLPAELIPLSWSESQLPLALSPLPWNVAPPPELVPVAWDG